MATKRLSKMAVALKTCEVLHREGTVRLTKLKYPTGVGL